MKDSTHVKLRKANELIKQGMGKNAACKQAKVPLATFYKNQKLQKPRVETMAIETPPSHGMLVCLIGTPDAVLQALKGIL